MFKKVSNKDMKDMKIAILGADGFFREEII